MKIRKWVRILHRDIGYLAVGLTIAYAISGVAVNHVDEWNPNYIIEKSKYNIQPIDDSKFTSDNDLAEFILIKINEEQKFKTTFRPDPTKFKIFLENNTIEVNLKNGIVEQEKVKNRPIFKEVNFLHLNHPKKLWTYVADVYAVALAFLAITGLFMIKGKNGIKGRGAWITGIGLLIPILFLLVYL